MAQPMGGAQTWTGAEAEVSERLRVPPLYRVLLHNDDYTTRDFVVYILQEIFHKPEQEAVSIMMAVHMEGIGVAGVYSFDVAETKAEQVRQLAERHEYPLLCTYEPDV